MGIQYGGPFANWSKKVGNVVGRVRQGRTVLSIYQPNVANPRTAAQVSARNRFSALTRFFASVSAAVKVGFHDLDGYKTGNPFSSAIGYNSKLSGITSVDAQGVVTVDPAVAILSQGTVALPYSPTAESEGTTVSLGWSDNSGHGNAESGDMVCIAARNRTSGDGSYFGEVAARSARTASITLPASWVGSSVDVWLFMFRGVGVVSDSVLVSTLTL